MLGHFFLDLLRTRSNRDRLIPCCAKDQSVLRMMGSFSNDFPGESDEAARNADVQSADLVGIPGRMETEIGLVAIGAASGDSAASVFRL